MNTPWIIGTIAAIVYFAYFEWYALDHPDRQNTLSRFLATLGAKWPLSIWIMGLFCGWLSAHLFWLPWNNPMGTGAG